MTNRLRSMSIVLPSLALSTALAAQTPAAAVTRAEQTIDGPSILRDIKTLSSDAFTGRAPGTRGEDSSIAFLQRRFREIGLAPGNPDGTYIQRVPLVGTTSSVETHLTAGGKPLNVRWLDDIVAWSLHADSLVTVKPADIVFVGYGVVAPEYKWDDFKGVDVRNKVVVMLVGDPPVPDPRDSTRLDAATFRGKAMTYYGRWTYKYEMAAARGAAAVLLVHQTGPAGYPWATVQSNAHEKLEIANGPKHASVEGWIHLDLAKQLFAASGKDFVALERTARTRAFRPVTLGTGAFTIHNAVRRFESRNVVGKIVGSDSQLKNEFVVLSAHWDAYGIGRPISGDSIYNGALDDASGDAWLLAEARALKSLPTPPKRTLLFLAVTA